MWKSHKRMVCQRLIAADRYWLLEKEISNMLIKSQGNSKAADHIAIKKPAVGLKQGIGDAQNHKNWQTHERPSDCP